MTKEETDKLIQAVKRDGMSFCACDGFMRFEWNGFNTVFWFVPPPGHQRWTISTGPELTRKYCAGEISADQLNDLMNEYCEVAELFLSSAALDAPAQVANEGLQ